MLVNCEAKYLLATSALGYVSFSLFFMLYRPFLNPVALIAVEGCEASLSLFKCSVVSRIRHRNHSNGLIKGFRPLGATYL